MPAFEASNGPTLFDPPLATATSPSDTETPDPKPRRDTASTGEAAPREAAPHEAATPAAAQPSDADAPIEATDAAENGEQSAQSDRKRLEQQLDALKRKESEIRRALALADHPELGEAVREIEGRAYALARADAKLAQGVSKGEARRRETIEKKLTSLRDKRAELELQITALETELLGIGSDRLATYEAERKQALEQLLVAVASHGAVFSSAGVEASQLVPDLARWLPELETFAKQLDAAHPQPQA